MTWYAVMTKSRAEHLASGALTAAGFETLYLHYATTIRHARRTLTALRPYFPRYIFAAVDHGQSIYEVANTQGVAQILGDSDGPLAVPADTIEQLRQGADENGLVGLPADPYGLPQRPPLDAGAEIRITAGPLTSYEATVLIDDRETIRVMVEMFKGQIEAVLPFAAVESVHPHGGARSTTNLDGVS